jgi:hypothetical protein
MKKSILIFLIIIVVGIVIIGTVSYRYNILRPKLRGTVVNLVDSAPVIGATVHIQNHAVDIDATTDHQGTFSVTRLKKGTYTVYATMDGFVTYRKVPVKISGRGTVDMGKLYLFPRPRGEGLFHAKEGEYTYIKENNAVKDKRLKKDLILKRFSGNVVEDESPIFMLTLPASKNELNLVRLEYQYPPNILEYNPTWKFDEPLKFENVVVDSTLQLVKVDYLPKGYYAFYTISENLLEIDRVWDFKIFP